MDKKDNGVTITIRLNLDVANTIRKVSAAYDKEVLAAKKLLLAYVKDRVK